MNEERNTLLTTSKSFQLGLVNNSRKPIIVHNYKIVSSELLQEDVSKATVCSKCKNPKSSLQLWQLHSKRTGLCESLLLKCSICEEKTFLKTSKCFSEENKQLELNVKAVQTGLQAANGFSSLQKTCTYLYLPQLPSSRNFKDSCRSILQ